MLVALHKMREVCFCLLGTNDFHVKAKNERFTAAGLRCRRNLKYENFTSSYCRLRQKIAPKRVPHVQHDYFLIKTIKSLICGFVVAVADPFWLNSLKRA